MYRYCIIAMLFVQTAYSCDFCACSPSVMNTDVANLQPQSSIGTATTYKMFRYKNSETGLTKTTMVSQLINISYAPKSWVELRTTLPIIWIRNDYNSKSDKSYGIGDMNLFSNFKVWSKSPFSHKKNLGQQLNLGLGIEFPTGKNKPSSDVLLQNFVFGSKSVDFLFSGSYSLSIKKYGLIASTFMKINTPNKEKVRYGNAYSFLLSANYSGSFRNLILIPGIGIKADVMQKNLRNNIIQKKSGSYAMYITYGLESQIKNWNFGFRFEHALVQNFSANSMLEKLNFISSIRYIIRKKTKTIKTEEISSVNSTPDK